MIKQNDCVFCVVDLHAITVKQDPKELKNNIRETVATFIASGINHEKILFLINQLFLLIRKLLGCLVVLQEWAG